MKKPPLPQEVMKMLEQHNVGVLGLRVWLEKKTKMGKVKNLDSFGFTKEYLTYYEVKSPETVISTFRSQALENDIEVLRYLYRHDELIPTEE